MLGAFPCYPNNRGIGWSGSTISFVTGSRFVGAKRASTTRVKFVVESTHLESVREIISKMDQIELTDLLRIQRE